MKVRRTIPPAAAPLYLSDLWYGLVGFIFKDRSIRRFEEEIKEYFGVRYVFPVSSGKAALALILQGLKSLSSRREVVIPAYTCYSVPSSVKRAGLQIVPCDINRQTFDFDPLLLEKAVAQETLCVVPSHLFGIPSAMGEIKRICRERGAYVVEDVAQAMGGSYQGKRLGTIGDIGFFSFGRGKSITSGSGGLIITNSRTIADAIAAYHDDLVSPSWGESWLEFAKAVVMSFFIHPLFYWLPAGLPFLKLGETVYRKDFPMKRLSGMKAGLLRNWIKRLEGSNQNRANRGAIYAERFRLQPVFPARIPWLRFPVVVQDQETRNRIYELSRKRGLGISLMYPASINKIQEIQADFQDRFFPVAMDLAERLLTLPTHPLVSKRDQEAIIDLFSEYIGLMRSASPEREKPPVARC